MRPSTANATSQNRARARRCGFEDGEGPGAATLSADVLPALIDTAIDHWVATEISVVDIETIRTAEIQLVDLPLGGRG